MKVRQSRNRNLYQAGLILIFIGFIVCFILGGVGVEFTFLINLLFFGGAGFCAGARAFYLDRYFKLMEKKELVDFWIFLNEKSQLERMVLYFSIRPVNTPNTNADIEKLRKTVNKFTYTTYLFFICIIVFQILIKQQ